MVSQLVGVYGWLRNPLRCPTKKWDTCGTEETLNLLFFLSIMATNSGNTSNASGSSQNANNGSSKNKSWADRVEEFSDSLKGKNAFANIAEERYFVIKRNDGDFSRTSPFLIQKAIQSIVGEPKNIKKLRTGELLIELQNNSQAIKLKKCTSLGNIPVTISAHRTLNSSKGVISEPDLIYVPESEILENLKDQGVTAVHRISITKNNNKIPTQHIILTISTPKLPKSIKAGYLECSIRPYIPNPLRCFNCQRFGHSKTSCRGKLTCGRCSSEGHDSSNCNDAFCCVNCKKDHPSYSRDCEKWKKEKEVQALRSKQNISYIEARKIIDSRTPTVGLSYAAATSKPKEKIYKSIGIQTECSNSSNSQPLTKKIQQQTSSKNSKKQKETASEVLSLPKPNTPKLPIH